MPSHDSYTVFIFFGSIFLITLFSLLFFKPKYGLFFLILLRPILDNINIFKTVTIPGVGLNMWQLVGIAIPSAMIFVCLVRQMDAGSKPINFFKHSFLNTYFWFLLFCLPSIYISANSILAFGSWLRLFTLWAVVVYADFALDSRKDVQKLLVVIALSSIYPLSRLLLDLFTGTRVEIGGLSRLTGGYFHMSILSIMLMFFIPVYLYNLNKKIETPNTFLLFVRKTSLFFGISLIILFIYLTHYRTTILSVVTLFVVFLLLRKKFLWVVLASGATAMLIFFVPSFRDRFTPLMIVIPHLQLLFEPRATPYDQLLSGRFGIWRHVLTTFTYQSSLANIFFGWGIAPQIRSIKTYGHNDLLYFMFHYGVFAVTLFYFFLFKLLRLSLRYSANLIPQIVGSLLIALIVSSMSHPTFMDVRNLLFLGAYIGVLIKYIETIPLISQSPPPATSFRQKK